MKRDLRDATMLPLSNPGLFFQIGLLAEIVEIFALGKFMTD